MNLDIEKHREYTLLWRSYFFFSFSFTWSVCAPTQWRVLL